jgi:hypothetical protein
VNWLRAKARYARWCEEETTVKDEMGNTLRYYKWELDKCETRAKCSESDGNAGHACYAWQQASMWRALLEEAELIFGSNAM